MNLTQTNPALQTSVRCSVAAAELSCVSAETIAQWRRRQIVRGGESLPISFLKHVNDQTVHAVWTALEAVETEGWQEQSFADWGVIAAPSMFARVSNAETILRFRQEGAWGVSPHVVPHQSLHAVSGTVSQALKIHGPNFGVSGGPNAAQDAFLIAAAMLADRRLPGLWLILVDYESEWIPAAIGDALPAPTSQALALALKPPASRSGGMQLSLGQHFGDFGVLAHLPEFQLGQFVEDWKACAALPRGRWRLADRHWLGIDWADSAEEVR